VRVLVKIEAKIKALEVKCEEPTSSHYKPSLALSKAISPSLELTSCCNFSL